MVKAIVIGDRDQFHANNREFLQEELGFTVEYLPGVWLRSLTEGDPRYSYAAFEAYYGRPPSLGEMGCALAHRQVFAHAIENGVDWSLVFEDDCVIKDPVRFRDCVSAVVENNNSKDPIVASFYTRQALATCGSRSFGTSRELRILRRPVTSTVCYLISHAAASILFAEQSPVRSSADWPAAANHFLFMLNTQKLVDHGERPSNIEPPPKRAPLFELQLITCVWYLRKRREFRSFSEYLALMILPRLAHRYCQLIRRLQVKEILMSKNNDMEG